MNRRELRVKLMSLIYELEIKDSSNLNDIDISDLDEFQLEVLQKYLEHKEDVDKYIQSSLDSWSLNTIGKVELSVLRLCVVEILYIDEIPYKVAINEAIEILKIYADEKSPSFVNAVLRKFIENNFENLSK